MKVSDQHQLTLVNAFVKFTDNNPGLNRSTLADEMLMNDTLLFDVFWAMFAGQHSVKADLCRTYDDAHLRTAMRAIAKRYAGIYAVKRYAENFAADG